MNNTGNAVPSTSVLDFVDNVQILDQLINSDAQTVASRLGVSLQTYQSLITNMKNSGGALAFADDATLKAFVPTVSNTLALSASTGTYFYWNGTVWTAISKQNLQWYPVLNAIEKGTLFRDLTSIYTVTAGSYYDNTGTLHTDGGTTWGQIIVPVKSGNWMRYSGPLGSLTKGEVIPVFSQLSSTQAWVSSLKTVTGDGSAIAYGTVYAQATQDGYVAIRCRTAETSTLGAIAIAANFDVVATEKSVALSIEAGLEKAESYGPAEDMTVLRPFSGAVFNASGVWTTGLGTGYRTYFVPVVKDDVVRFDGPLGAYTLSEELPILSQTDTNRAFVSKLFPFSTDTKVINRTAFATATQTGFIAVYVRIVTGSTFTIKKFRKLLSYSAGVSDTAGLKDNTFLASIKQNLQWSTDGTTATAASWNYGLLPVKAGDMVECRGLMGDYSTGTSRPVIIQLDSSQKFVSVLAKYTTDGAGPVQERHIATAAQDGYVALQYRVSGNSPFMFLSSGSLLVDVIDAYFEDQLERGNTIDITLASKYSVNNTALDSKGAVLADTNYRTVYAKVKSGDTVTVYTATGALAANESAASDGTVPYLIQLDRRKANPLIKKSVLVTGTLTGYQVLTATASQDGYMACRVYAADRKWPYVRVSRPSGSSSSTSLEAPVVSGQFERLPVNANALWDYNSSPYNSNNIVIANGFQYVLVINPSRNPVIMQRSIYGGAWAVFDLSTVTGNPLNTPTELDGHNIYSIAVTPSGKITIAGNMHGSAWRGVMSVKANDITSWVAFDWGNGGTDNTYPSFLTYPDKTLQCYFRRGVRIYLSGINADDTLGTFRFMIGSKTDGTGGPYCNRLAIGNDGVLHACWGYRLDASQAGANEGLYYAKSADKGVTWTNAAGTSSWSLSDGALSDTRSEKVFTAASLSGYINQNGGCVDVNGYYHTCITQTDASGYTQIVHIWFDGSNWKSEVVSKFTFAMDLSLNLVMNDLSRPIIGSTPSGKTYIFYHTTKMGRSGQLRAIDVTTAGSPVDAVIAFFDIGTQAMSINTDRMLETGDYLAILMKGTANSSSTGYGVYANQPVMLSTIPMQ